MDRAHLPRRGDRPPHPQAGGGGPHHHDADARPRQGARGREGRAPHVVPHRVAARAVHGRGRAAVRGPEPRRGATRWRPSSPSRAPSPPTTASTPPRPRWSRPPTSSSTTRRSQRSSSTGSCAAASTRSRATSTRRASSSTPTCCGRSRSPDGRRASTRAPVAASPARTGRSTPRGAGPCARTAGRRAPRRPRPRRSCLLSSLVEGDWAVADASDDRHRREAAGLVAAYAQFHLERKVRSLGMVDRT